MTFCNSNFLLLLLSSGDSFCGYWEFSFFLSARHTGQADHSLKMHFILCPLLPLRIYQKQKGRVPGGGLRIQHLAIYDAQEVFLVKVVGAAAQGNGGERVGQEATS